MVEEGSDDTTAARILQLALVGAPARLVRPLRKVR